MQRLRDESEHYLQPLGPHYYVGRHGAGPLK
jgi:hypothetical protein